MSFRPEIFIIPSLVAGACNPVINSNQVETTATSSVIFRQTTEPESPTSPAIAISDVPTFTDPENLPEFDTFTEMVKNGKAENITGLYVPSVFAAPVIQIPDPKNISYVDKKNISQFPWNPEVFGVVAEKTQIVKYFLKLEKGNKINVIFGDGSFMEFVVYDILELKVKKKFDPFSDLTTLDGNTTYTPEQALNMIYENPDPGLFELRAQTCSSASVRRFLFAREIPPEGFHK